MKFRCTMVIDLEIPSENTEDGAMALFTGVAGTALATSRLFPQNGIKLIEAKAEKTMEKKQ